MARPHVELRPCAVPRGLNQPLPARGITRTPRMNGAGLLRLVLQWLGGCVSPPPLADNMPLRSGPVQSQTKFGAVPCSRPALTGALSCAYRPGGAAPCGFKPDPLPDEGDARAQWRDCGSHPSLPRPLDLGWHVAGQDSDAPIAPRLGRRCGSDCFATRIRTLLLRSPVLQDVRYVMRHYDGTRPSAPGFKAAECL